MTAVQRVALVDPDDRLVLTVDGADGPELPGFGETWLDHGDLARGTGDPLALPAAPAARLDDGTHLHVFVLGAQQRPAGSWRPVQSLEARLAARIEESISTWDSGAHVDGVASWYHRGWYDDAVAWIDRALAARGRNRSSPAVLERAWSLSAVLRTPTEGDRDVWFKATCNGFHAEPVLTEAVSAVLPENTPDVIAVDASRAWMLMEPLPSTSIDETEVRRRAPEIGTALAEAQLTSVGHLPDLVAAGLPDRGAAATSADFERVLQPVDGDPELIATRGTLVGRCRKMIRELWSSGLPDTLNHGDLHLGNIAWAPDRVVIYDWTDACLTHPFLDASHLASSIEVTVDAAAAAAFGEAHQAQWAAAHPGVDLTRVRDLARIVNDVFQVVTYDKIARAQPSASRWELDDQVPRLIAKLEEKVAPDHQA